MEQHLSRRAFLAGLTAAGFAACTPDPFAQWLARPAQAAGPRNGRPRVVILGMDGMDPSLLKRFIDQGVMPNFKSFIAKGDFKPLATIDPPQSPVAWSTFITGMDPGGHGIYDFVHRNPATYQARSSMSGMSDPRYNVGFGSFKMPLLPGKLSQLRKGRAFWEILEDEGYSTVIHQIPTNYPVTESDTVALAGMGTPDVRGTSGTLSYYTSHLPESLGKNNEGEMVVVKVENNQVKAQLLGPPNTVKDPVNPVNTTIDFTVSLDATELVAKFSVQDHEFILKQGEWSEWIPVEFELVPIITTISATCRFYLQEVRPNFRLYVTPLQINPAKPSVPISSPSDFSKELQKKIGYYYTQELPADTKAYGKGIFNGREFWTQSQMVYNEQRRALDYYLERYDNGPDLLFFYFSSVDQGCHMFWRDHDTTHPAHQHDPLLSTALQKLYEEMDEVLGRTLEVLGPEDTLIVMSDHGFCPFTRSVNLNSWMVENNYVKLRFPNRRDGYKYFENCKWDRTRAFNLGLNAVYINTKGREAQGVVDPGKEYEHLVRKIEEELLDWRDPANGRQVISSIIVPRRDFHGDYVADGPDLIIGFAKDYRISWKSPLGEFPVALLEDNLDPWSGDHCISSQTVPGILISNRKICIGDPSLYDLTAGVLHLFGLKPLPEMLGRNCFV